MNNDFADSEATWDGVIVRFGGRVFVVAHPAFTADHERRMAPLLEVQSSRWDDRVPLDQEALRLLKQLLVA